VRYIRVMGWLRLAGSLKLQVSFTEYRLFYRALLQKRPIILRSLLIVATPYLNSVYGATHGADQTENIRILRLDSFSVFSFE